MLVLSLAMPAGCTTTRHQTVDLRTEPSGAAVYRQEAGVWQRLGTTPMEVSQGYTAATSQDGRYYGISILGLGGVMVLSGGGFLLMDSELISVEAAIGTLASGVATCLIGWLLTAVLTDETPTTRQYAVALDGFEEKQFSLKAPGKDAAFYELTPAWYSGYGIRSGAELTGEAAVPRLIPALADPRPAVRLQAVAAFAAMTRADLRAKKALEEVARADADPAVRRLAGEALRKLRFVRMAAAPAGGGAAPVVAVFDVFDPSGRFDPKVVETLSATLAAILAETGAFRLVPREQVRERLRRSKGDSYRQAYDEGSQIELGKALAAQRTLATQLLRVGHGCAISATFFDLKTETAGAGALVETGCGEKELLAALRRVVQKLMEQEADPAAE